MERNIVQVTPFMHVPDREAALALMTGTLGFRIDFRQSDYAYVSRADDVHGPADKPYRQRELLVLAPDGNLIAFGQAIAEPAG